MKKSSAPRKKIEPPRSTTRDHGECSAIRPRAGAVLLEGISAFILFVTVFLLFMVLLFNVGVFVYYKIKLATVTTQVADYAACLPVPSAALYGQSIEDANIRANPNASPGTGGAFSTWQSQVLAYADQQLIAVGLPKQSSGSAVTVQYSPASGDTMLVAVTVAVNQLSLFNWTVCLPPNISMSDAAVGAVRYHQPPGILQIWPEKFALDCFAKTPPVTNIKVPKVAFYGFKPAGVPNNAGVKDTTQLRSFPYTTINMGLPSTNDGDAADTSLGSGYWSEEADTWNGPNQSLPNTVVHNLTKF